MMNNIEKERVYWANRAGSYLNLEWASRQGYLQAVVHAGELHPADVVLDAGTGTGLIANAVAADVARVIGIDISPEMMNGNGSIRNDKCKFELGDIRNLQFSSASFSKVFSRMVFNSLIESTDEAARECYRVLKPGGKFVLSEGIPPARAAEEWYTEMFRLKEERLTFFPETLENLLSRAGFSEIRTDIHVSPQVSIANWLENSGLPAFQQEKIMKMHLEMPRGIKDFYHATFKEDGDVLLDMKFAIVSGKK